MYSSRASTLANGSSHDHVAPYCRLWLPKPSRRFAQTFYPRGSVRVCSSISFVRCEDCLIVSQSRSIGLNVLGYQSYPLQRCHPVCGHEGSSHLFSILALRDERSSLLQYTTRQPIMMLGFYLLAFSRSPSRKKEHKLCFS